MDNHPIHGRIPFRPDRRNRLDVRNRVDNRDRAMGAAASSTAEASKSAETSFYNPTPGDIFLVRALFNKKFELPPDVVDVIFDHAEYWAHSSNEIDFEVEHKHPLRISGTSKNEDKFLLRSYPVGLMGFKEERNLSQELSYDHTEAKPAPLQNEHEPSFFAKLAENATPRLANPVRKVVFTMRSKDQGWGGDAGTRHTFKKSSTWFEAGLERFEANQTCDDQCVIDRRFESANSHPLDFPLCALRPVQPPVERRGGEQDDDDTAQGTFKYVHPLHAREDWKIQCNKVAMRNVQDHVVTWRWSDNIDPESPEAEELVEQGRGQATGDGSFVRSLKLGDVITVWGKARYNGWANIVYSVKIDVYWAL